MVRAPIEQLRRRILRSLDLGLALAAPLTAVACGLPVVAGDADEGGSGGVTTDPSGDGSSSESGESGDGPDTGTASATGTGTSDGSGTASSDGSTSFTDDGPVPTSDSSDSSSSDGSVPDLPAPLDCTVTQMDGPASDIDPECPLTASTDGLCWSNLYLGCVEPEPGQSCDRICPEGDCIGEWWNCNGDVVYDAPVAICGPYLIDGKCCSIGEIIDLCGTDGRPFVVGGRKRTAELLVLDPEDRVEFDDSLPEAIRERIAEHWARIARAEHASIASFARFAAQLLAIAAPPALVGEAIAAADDEVRHAEAALELAEAFAGRSLDFGPLEVADAFADANDLEQLTLACVIEGCIGETLAALELATTAARCGDLGLAELLQAIADDEARHAALAWAFVRWTLEREPSLREAVIAGFERLIRRSAASTQVVETLDPRLLLDHGCLPRDERERVEHEGVFDLILPCAEAMLGDLAMGEELV